MKFDWITWGVEALGVLILAVWIILPIGEFRLIFRGVMARRKREESAVAGKRSGLPTGRRDVH